MYYVQMFCLGLHFSLKTVNGWEAALPAVFNFDPLQHGMARCKISRTLGCFDRHQAIKTPTPLNLGRQRGAG